MKARPDPGRLVSSKSIDNSDGLSIESKSPVLLLRSPAPNKFESPIGYLLRLTETNGYSRPTIITNMAMKKASYVVTVGWDFRRLQPLLGKVKLPDGFGYRPARYVRGRGSIQGHGLSTSHIGMVRSRVCPQCVKELGYIPSTWDLKAYIACHVHKCMMLKHCPKCKKRITNERSGLLICQCGFDFSKAENVIAKPELCAISEVLHAQVTGDGRELIVSKEIGFPLDELLAMDLDVLCKVLVEIALLCANRQAGVRKVRKNAEVSNYLIDAGVSFSNWPNNFYELCSSWHKYIKASTKGINSIYFYQCFVAIFLMLHKHLKRRKKQTVFLLKATLEYGFRNWDGAPIVVRGKLMKAIKFPSAHYGYMESAALVQNITLRKFAYIYRNGGVPVEIFIRNIGTRPLFDLYALSKLTVLPRRSFRLRRSAEFLGIPRRALHLLISSGVLNCTFRKAIKVVAVDDLEAFKNSIFKMARKSTARDLMPFSSVYRSKITIPKLVEIFRDIVAGKRNVYKRGGEANISELLIKADSIGKIYENLQDIGEVISICAIGQRFGLNKTESRAIGLLFGGWHDGIIGPVRTTAVKSFLSEHVALRRIVAISPAATLEVRKSMQRKGLSDYVIRLPYDSNNANKFATFIKRSGTRHVIHHARKFI